MSAKGCPDQCPECGSNEDPYFSRMEPMGYFCPDCGKEVGADAAAPERPDQCPALARLTYEKVDLLVLLGNAEQERDRARQENEKLRDEVAQLKAMLHGQP